MKRIINQKRYNTDSARVVATAGKVTLYRKQTGEFFFCDELNIIPVTLEEAGAWGKENMAEEDYNRIFLGNGGDGKKQINVTVSMKAYNKLRLMQMTQKKDLNKIIEDLIFSAAE